MKHPVTFTAVSPSGIEGTPKTIDVGVCPNLIIDPEHYRTDGSCKCNDIKDTLMMKWGYVWDCDNKTWISPDAEPTEADIIS